MDAAASATRRDGLELRALELARHVAKPLDRLRAVDADPFLSLYERYKSELYGIASRCDGKMTGPFCS
jgi:hypothetical protein